MLTGPAVSHLTMRTAAYSFVYGTPSFSSRFVVSCTNTAKNFPGKEVELENLVPNLPSSSTCTDRPIILEFYKRNAV